MIIDLAKPRRKRVEQFAGETILILRVCFHQTAQRRSGGYSHVACKSAFVLLVGYQRVNLSAADQRNVSSLATSEVLLHKHALGVIDIPQPGASVFNRFAKDGVYRTCWGAQRIF